MIEIVTNPIDTESVIRSVGDAGAGGINVFIGTTRDISEGRRVLKLKYEAYEPMALEELRRIADKALERWQLSGVSIVHRVGIVAIGEASVVIAVSAPHRAEAFEACRFIIDTLKEKVPIWKKEVFADGEEWVGDGGAGGMIG